MPQNTYRNEYQPIIIIGAGRSGTNMLRDILTRLPGFGTWACDEINYIWRHGNIKQPTDEFTPEHATPFVSNYIQRAFTRLAARQELDYVVEKTCANSLRVSFVNDIIPNAKYIFIVRDGRDVVASAMKRWTASLDIPYIFKKARYVPINDMPYYAFRYASNRLYRLFSDGNRLASWGPRFEGMDIALSSNDLAEVCAIQWKRSVEKAHEDFQYIDCDKVYRVRYEDFVQQPASELRRIQSFLDIKMSEQSIQQLVSNVSTKSVGKWQQNLSKDEVEEVELLIKPTLEKFGY